MVPLPTPYNFTYLLFEGQNTQSKFAMEIVGQTITDSRMVAIDSL